MLIPTTLLPLPYRSNVSKRYIQRWVVNYMSSTSYGQNTKCDFRHISRLCHSARRPNYPPTISLNYYYLTDWHVSNYIYVRDSYRHSLRRAAACDIIEPVSLIARYKNMPIITPNTCYRRWATNVQSRTVKQIIEASKCSHPNKNAEVQPGDWWSV